MQILSDAAIFLCSFYRSARTRPKLNETLLKMPPLKYEIERSVGSLLM